MKMKKMALAAAALVLALGVSVCSAHCPGAVLTARDAADTVAEISKGMGMQATAGTDTTLIIVDEALRMQPNAKTGCASLYLLPKETGRLWQ